MSAEPRVSPTTILTGGAGWLGRALVHRLSSESGRLSVLVQQASETEQVERAACRDVDIVVGDITRRDTVARLFDRVGPDSVVIHTAGIIHPRRTREFVDVNTVGTRNIAEFARSAGVRRLVHVSSNSPFGTNADRNDLFRADEPYHPYLGYGASKMLAEVAVLEEVERGLDAVVVRPPWFYGPFQPPRQTTFFRMVRTGRFPILGDGLQRRSMVYIDNLVDGILAAAVAPAVTGRGFWIADAEPYTIRDIVETVKTALRAEGYETSDRQLRVPAVVGRLAETADRVIQRTGRYHQQVHVLGELDKTIACDISTSTSVLGYIPQVSLYEGMRRSIAWCRSEGLEL